MAGVNLSEESARILATNSELVGSVTRSCKDETFLSTSSLSRRTLEIGEAPRPLGEERAAWSTRVSSQTSLLNDRQEVWRQRAGARRGQLHLPRDEAAAAEPVGESDASGSAEKPQPQGANRQPIFVSFII